MNYQNMGNPSECKNRTIEIMEKFIHKEGLKLNNKIRFGIDKKINTDKALDIIFLQEIYEDKINCADWLSEYSQSYIENIIKNLIKSTC